MEPHILDAVHIVWDYLKVGDNPRPADCLIVLGSRDDRVASYAAELARTYRYEYIVVTGGIAHHNDLLATDWLETTEAAHFLTVMRASGLNEEIWLEEEATNTGDNAQLSYQLLAARGRNVQSILVVTKPYMSRRAKATFEKQWPDTDTKIFVTSPDLTFETYCNKDQKADDVINIMVGDLERIIYYPELGFQTKQVVPNEVLEALSLLQIEGFTKRSIQ